MNNTEQGMLYPFRLSGSKMRQSAQLLRRQGQVLDAVSLIRRSAEQEDTPAAWQMLAVELRQLGCWEAAAQLMGRVLAAGEIPDGAWMELARNFRALGQYPMALDCVYHQLHDDPWSSEGDAARMMLSELESSTDEKEPRRVPMLVRRGLSAWHSGNRRAGEKQIRRALRITHEKQRLLSTAAMMCMLQMDVQGALGYLCRALRRDPCDGRTLIALSTLMYQMGRVRLARGLLQKASPLCDGVMAEDAWLTAAWAQDVWPQMAAFLDGAMKRYPHRIPLLAARATLLCERGDDAAARALWQEILAIDPDDRAAESQLAASLAGESLHLLPPMTIPVTQRRAQTQELRALRESAISLRTLLRPGSRQRRLIDWHMVSPDPEEIRLAQSFFADADDAAVPYLRTVVSRPLIKAETRQWALIRLAEMGHTDEMYMSAGVQYTTVQCRRIEPQRQSAPWRIFLQSLLTETRRYRQSGAIAEFAAKIWRCMSPAQRAQAAGSGKYAWCKAVEIMYLRSCCLEEKAARVAGNAALAPRKISRVLRRVAERMHKI